MSNKEIEVLDGIMGSGKTRGILQWMLDRPNNKYIYISPLLSEVNDRVPTECAKLHFVSPNKEEHNTKAEHLLDLLKEGYNVSFTHALFENLNRNHLYWISYHRYTLIIDEDYNKFKFTPEEAERFQTVPVGYTQVVSDNQRFKLLGNGWTVDVIAHILRGLNDKSIY